MGIVQDIEYIIQLPNTTEEKTLALSVVGDRFRGYTPYVDPPNKDETAIAMSLLLMHAVDLFKASEEVEEIEEKKSIENIIREVLGTLTSATLNKEVSIKVNWLPLHLLVSHFEHLPVRYYDALFQLMSASGDVGYLSLLERYAFLPEHKNTQAAQFALFQLIVALEDSALIPLLQRSIASDDLYERENAQRALTKLQEKLQEKYK